MLLLYTDEKTPKLPAKMTFSNISAKAEQKLLWKLLIINLKSSLNIEPKRAQDLWVSVFYCLKACLNKILKFWEIGNEKVVTLFFFFFPLLLFFSRYKKIRTLCNNKRFLKVKHMSFKFIRCDLPALSLNFVRKN